MTECACVTWQHVYPDPSEWHVMDLCDLHLISWNVAGLKTTLEQLRRFGFAGFLNRHRADVLCLQEVKLSSKASAPKSGDR